MISSYAKRAGITRVRAHGPEERILRLPARFSLIENPDETLAFIETLVAAGRGGVRRFGVDQDGLMLIDFCAGLLLNVLAVEMKRSLHAQFRGNHPSDPDAFEIAVATGLPQAIGVPTPQLKNFDTFPLWSDRKRGGLARSPYGSAKRNTVGHELISRINQNYRRHGHEISEDAKEKLAWLVGEVLDNAEEHHGTGWWASGYVREPHGKTYGECHIALFNFGPTLSETLQELPPGSDLRSVIEELIARHTQSLAFVRRARWTADDLWTLYALQEGVTRLFGQKRGFGTVDMIETFEQIGGSAVPGLKPKMCILSGRTHILFDGRYHLATAPDGRKIIAFNDEGNLELPPAPGTVTHLDHYFPGTIISLRFYIDSVYLDGVAEPHDHKRD